MVAILARAIAWARRGLSSHKHIAIVRPVFDRTRIEEVRSSPRLARRNLAFHVTEDAGGTSRADRVGRDVARNHASRADHRVLADDHVGKNGDARSDRRAPSYPSGLYGPVLFS